MPAVDGGGQLRFSVHLARGAAQFRMRINSPPLLSDPSVLKGGKGGGSSVYGFLASRPILNGDTLTDGGVLDPNLWTTPFTDIEKLWEDSTVVPSPLGLFRVRLVDDEHHHHPPGTVMILMENFSQGTTPFSVLTHTEDDERVQLVHLQTESLAVNVPGVFWYLGETDEEEMVEWIAGGGFNLPLKVYDSAELEHARLLSIPASTTPSPMALTKRGGTIWMAVTGIL